MTNKFKVSFNCNQKQLGDILVSLAPYKVSDFDFGLISEVPYSENRKRAMGITSLFFEVLEKKNPIARAELKAHLIKAGFKPSDISNTINRLKKLKRIKLQGDNILALK